jgi:hypothetical protein
MRALQVDCVSALWAEPKSARRRRRVEASLTSESFIGRGPKNRKCEKNPSQAATRAPPGPAPRARHGARRAHRARRARRGAGAGVRRAALHRRRRSRSRRRRRHRGWRRSSVPERERPGLPRPRGAVHAGRHAGRGRCHHERRRMQHLHRRALFDSGAALRARPRRALPRIARPPAARCACSGAAAMPQRADAPRAPPPSRARFANRIVAS